MSHSNISAVSDLVLETVTRRGTAHVHVAPKVGADPHWQDEHVEPLEGSQGIDQFLKCLDTYTDYRIWLDVGTIYESRVLVQRQDIVRLRAFFIKIWGDTEHPQFYT